MKTNKKKYLIIASVAIVVVAGIYFLLPGGAKSELKLDTVKISKGNISTSVTATGTVEPIKSVEVGTQVSGVISKIYVDYNSVVRKGEILAELDKKLLQSELENSMASLESKKVELMNVERTYKRQKELWSKQAISQADWESAETNYQTAKLAVTSSKAAVVKAQTNLSYATIYSTIDGVVISRAVEEGQTVAASFSTPTLFTIANDLTKMRVIANVDEADIGGVKQGQRVTFTVAAYPDQEFEGRVAQVRLEATTTSNVVTYQVVIEAPNPDLKLKPGLTASASIYTVEESGVVLVPTKAFRFTPDQDQVKQMKEVRFSPALQVDSKKTNQKVVWVKSANKVYPKLITIGLTDGINAVVADGLAVDEEVVTGMSQNVIVGGSDSQSTGATETSPFMPKPPGGSKTKK